MRLTENFTLEEFTYSATAEALDIDNIPSKQDLENITYLAEKILQPIRNRYGKPITVNSGFRCDELNKAVGGSNTSQHRNGGAGDIEGEDNKELFSLIVEMIEEKTITVGQLIAEKTDENGVPAWIHISIPYSKKNHIIYNYK